MSPNSGPIAAQSNSGSMRKRLITLGIVGAIMLLEGVGVVVAVKMTGHSPATGEAAQGVQDPAQRLEQMDAELGLVDCDAINRKSGHPVVVHVSLSVRVAPANQEHAGRLIAKRQDTLKDRVQMILRRADPQYLNEPNLDTIKRQIKHELDAILGDEELVLEVLIPQMLQSRSHL